MESGRLGLVPLLVLPPLIIGSLTGLLPGIAGAANGSMESQFTFAVIGDRTTSPEAGEYERILDEVSRLGPDLIISVGDHIQGYTSDSTEVESQWDEFTALIGSTGIQYHLTPGNHDIWDRASEAIFRRRFGGPDRYFRYMGKVFVLLDVSGYSRADALPKEKIDWLKRVLDFSKDSDGIFVFYHRPFWCEDFSAGRPNLLHEIFRSYPVKAVFTGHYHRYFHEVRDSIEYFSLSSSGGELASGGRDRGAFYSYMFCRVKGDDVSMELLEPGIFTPVDVVTYEDALAMARAEAKSVRMSELLAYGFDMSGTGQVTVTVENPGRSTLSDTVAWVLRGDWAVQPMRDYIEVPPGETGTLTSFVRCDGSLFPVPVLGLRVPCCGDKLVEVTMPLNVKRVLYAEYTDSQPVIDGVLNDSQWLAQAGESRFFGPQGGRTAADSTLLRVCYDSSNIYVGVECLDRDVDGLAASVKERDAAALYDDSVVLLFEPRVESRVFFQVSVNPLGTLFDRKVEICPFGTYVPDPSWDPDVRVAASLGPDRWVVELALPIAALSPAGLGGSRWGFNFSRVQQRLGTSADFQAPFRYRSDAIGLLGFR
jgi:hypothetical protein